MHKLCMVERLTREHTPQKGVREKPPPDTSVHIYRVLQLSIVTVAGPSMHPLIDHKQQDIHASMLFEPEITMNIGREHADKKKLDTKRSVIEATATELLTYNALK